MTNFSIILPRHSSLEEALEASVEVTQLVSAGATLLRPQDLPSDYALWYTQREFEQLFAEAWIPMACDEVIR